MAMPRCSCAQVETGFLTETRLSWLDAPLVCFWLKAVSHTHFAGLHLLFSVLVSLRTSKFGHKQSYFAEGCDLPLSRSPAHLDRPDIKLLLWLNTLKTGIFPEFTPRPPAEFAFQRDMLHRLSREEGIRRRGRIGGSFPMRKSGLLRLVTHLTIPGKNPCPILTSEIAW